MNADIVTARQGEPRVDSRLIAERLGVRHKATFQLIQQHEARLLGHGVLPFQMEKPTSRKGGRPERYALLNEAQATFILTLSRNTERVVALKDDLVHAFMEARRALQARASYLPVYRALHDTIRAIGCDDAHQRLLHLNVNKLVNKVVGVEAGGRPRADAPRQAMLVASQILVAEAIRDAADHKDAYARARAALEPLQAAVLEGVRHE